MSDTAYVFRRLELSPTEAARRVDHWHRRLATTGTGSRFRRAADRLWLSRSLSTVRSDPSALRRTHGLLWVRGRPVRIELEISVWSAETTTVAIRPRRLPSVVETDRYGAAAGRALDELVEGLTTTQIDPVRALGTVGDVHPPLPRPVPAHRPLVDAGRIGA